MKAIIRKDEQAVSPVIATILMVAITVVLAAVLYVMVSGLIGTNPTSKPVITMTLNTKTATGADILVTGAQPAVPYTNFKVNLQVGTTFGTAVNLLASGTNTTIAVGGANYNVKWQNPGGSGNLVGGDHFTLYYPASAPAAGTSITLILIWTDGSTAAQSTYQV